jgi:hypothetical protein
MRDDIGNPNRTSRLGAETEVAELPVWFDYALYPLVRIVWRLWGMEARGQGERVRGRQWLRAGGIFNSAWLSSPRPYLA